MTNTPYDSFEFTHHGHKFIARLYYDEDHGAPWDESDGHGPVSDWVSGRYHFTGHAPKRPGQRPIGDSDHGARRFYDWQEATAIAKRDGWGLAPDDLAALEKRLGRKPTRKQIIREAVQRDYDYLDRWARDLWHWCGVSVAPMQPSYDRLREAVEAAIDVEIDDDARDTLDSVICDLQRALDEDDEYAPEDYSNALWGIGSEDGQEYLMETANELADQIIADMESD